MAKLAFRRAVSLGVSEAHADSPFDRFKDLKKVEVRKAPAKDTLKVKREMRGILLGIKPRDAVKLIDLSPQMTLFRALEKAEREGKVLFPNSVLDGAYKRKTIEEAIRSRGYVWTGTGIIFEAPDTPFAERVVFNWRDKHGTELDYSVVFEVPVEFRGRENCAITVEYPDFRMVKVGERKYEFRLERDAALQLTEGFPKTNDMIPWYGADPRTGVPCGKPHHANNVPKNARFITRGSNGAYAGVIAHMDGTRGINLDCTLPTYAVRAAYFG